MPGGVVGAGESRGRREEQGGRGVGLWEGGGWGGLNPGIVFGRG